MKKKFLAVIAFLAIIFGLQGLMSGYFFPQESVIVAEAMQEKKVDVWFFQHEVSRGEQVDSDDFKLVTMSIDRAKGFGLTEDMDPPPRQGAVYRRDIHSGEIAFEDKWVLPNQVGYAEAVIVPGRVPYVLSVSPDSIVGGVITNDSLVDVLSFSLPDDISIEATEYSNVSKRESFVTAILTGIRVLQVMDLNGNMIQRPSDAESVKLILELTRKQVAAITVAKRISVLEVHKSIGDYRPSDLHVKAGDVLSDFKPVTEYRANMITLK